MTDAASALVLGGGESYPLAIRQGVINAGKSGSW